MKPLILAIAIIILVSVRFGKPAGAKEAERKRKEFWDREREANLTPKKDISGLDYLIIPLSTLPFHFESSVSEEVAATVTPASFSEAQLEAIPKEIRQELAYVEKQILKLAEKRIKNFTGLSNTVLKLAYGAANLPALSACDQNYTILVRYLQKWGNLLADAGCKEDAITVLAYAVSIGSDISATYTTLANLYIETEQAENITPLIIQAQTLPTLLNDSLFRSLTDIRDSSMLGKQSIHES